METKEFEELSAWINNAIREALGGNISQCHIEPFQCSEGQFASSMFEISLKSSSGSVSYVAKVRPCGAFNTKDVLRTREQFHNEIVFLKKIVPRFKEMMKDVPESSEVFRLFPTYVCSREDEYQSLLVLEDLRPKGFKLASKIFDLEHTLFALKWLGKFHSLSYIAKNKDTKEFLEMVREIQNVRFEPTPLKKIESLVNKTAAHPFELLKTFYPDYYYKHEENINTILQSFRNAYVILAETTFPEEPLAVLCHGDYLSNNMMFRYDCDGHPIEMIFIDFQLMSYSSPAIDLAVILYENTTPELRKEHWNEIFETYTKFVADYLPQRLREKEKALDVINKEFARRAVHGFLIAAMFLEVDNVDRNDMIKIMKEKSLDVSDPDQDYELTKEVSKICPIETKLRLAGMCKEVLERKFKLTGCSAEAYH